MENDHKVESFEHFNNIKNQEIIMDSANSKATFHNPTVSASAAKVVSNNTSPKMGSRRIFTPQFKLQVLESYRNDHDCKGNQRATARKYNIHRRQIQKWLQCETSLRSSVANINQNSVKHQFHNVSMQQQQSKSHAMPSQSYTPTQQQHATHLCLESTKFSTSPNKIYEVASISSCAGLPSAVETQDILDANTVAVVTATSGTITRTNTSENSSAPPVSNLQPPAMISTNRSANAPMAPLLHHHHHHYGIPTYSKMSSSAAVPMLVHHLTSAHQTQYQYHSMHYNPPAISHHQTEKPQISYFTPTLFLPNAASTSNNYIDGNNDYLEKLESFPLGAKTYPKIWSDKSFLYNRAQFRIDYECPNGNRGIDSSNTTESFNINQFKADSSYSTSYPFGPMDLSLRHNKETKSELFTNTKTNLQVHEIPVKKERICNTVEVVDLTYRKRRSFNVLHSTDNYKYECPEKQQKLSDTDANENGLNHLASCSSKSNEDDDIEIEVGTEEKFSPASKPVKLFKPYLLDECDDNHVDNCGNRNANEIEGSEEIDQTVKTADFVNENTFPETVKENIDICAEGSNFLVESRSESPRSACSPTTYIPTMSPTNFQYSKGSPASSGYESSTSTYSDTSLSSRKGMYSYGQNYSVTLQMQTLCQENNQVTHPSKQVQSWLEKDDFNSLEINPTAALIV